MLSTQTADKLRKIYQSEMTLGMAYQAMKVNAEYSGLNNTANLFSGCAKSSFSNASKALDALCSGGERLTGPLACVVTSEVFQARAFRAMFDVARDAEEEVADEVASLGPLEGPYFASKVTMPILGAHDATLGAITKTLDRLRTRMGDGIKTGAQIGELDPAEIHGETIHDIDVWIGQTFGGL